MIQVLQPYRIPIVYNDLSLEESFNDVFYTLESLSGTIDDVFTRIEKRLSDEKKRVDNVKKRVINCKGKVDQVKGSTKATTVFSTAKFPAPKALPLYPTLFSQVNEISSPYREIEDEIQYVSADAKLSSLQNSELSADLTSILFRLNSHNTQMERVEFIMEDDGLGLMPSNIPSVGSMLLFNSGINPYKEYQTLDNLVSAGRTNNNNNNNNNNREKDKEEDDLNSRILASAPTTLLSADALPDIQALDLMFKPTMGEMISLALPENLPLDFIASGIQFNAGDLPSIAPSSYGKANYSYLQITDGGYSSVPSAKQQRKDSLGGIPSPPSMSAGGPPPPPPPPPGGMSFTAPNSDQSPPPMSASFPPPPPPKPVDLNNNNNNPLSPLSSPSGGLEEAMKAPAGLRNNLLDSIKGMNVSKLKSNDNNNGVADRPTSKPAYKKAAAEANKPLTMADALKERLMRRHNALSGKDEKEQKRKDSLIVQAARSEPTPPPPQMARSSSQKHKNHNDDDEDSYKGKSTKSKKHVANSDEDSDSIASDFSDESRKPVSKRAAPVPSKPPVIHPPPPSFMPPPPAGGRKGSGLLDTSNTALASMLSKASGKKVGSNDSGSDNDDWD